MEVDKVENTMTQSATSGFQSLQLMAHVLGNTLPINNDAGKICKSIATHAQNAHDYFDKAKDVASRTKTTMDDKLLSLVLQKERCKQEISEIKHGITILQTRIYDTEVEKQYSENQVENASSQVNQAERDCNMAKTRMRQVENACERVYSIPIIGGMLCDMAGIRDSYNQAREIFKHEEDNLKSLKRDLRNRKSELSAVKLTLSELNTKKYNENKKLDQLKEKYHELKQYQAAVIVERDRITKRALFLSLMFGKTKVLCDEAQNIFASNLEPLLNVLADISNHKKSSSDIKFLALENY